MCCETHSCHWSRPLNIVHSAVHSSAQAHGNTDHMSSPVLRAEGPSEVTLYTCRNSWGPVPPTMLKPNPRGPLKMHVCTGKPLRSSGSSVNPSTEEDTAVWASGNQTRAGRAWETPCNRITDYLPQRKTQPESVDTHTHTHTHTHRHTHMHAHTHTHAYR